MARKKKGAAAADRVPAETDRTGAARGRVTSNPFATANLAGAPGRTLAAVAIAFLLGFALLQVLVVGPANATHATAVAEAHASELAAHLDSMVLRLAEDVTGLASDPRVTATLRPDSDLDRAGLEAGLAALVPDGLRVRILASGQGEPALTEDPPLTFAGIDLVRRAELGEAPAPEAFRANGRLYLNAAAPVLDRPGGRTLGTVLVTYASSVLGPSPEAIGASGRFALTQSQGGGSLNLLGEALADPAGLAPLAHPQWRLAWAPAAQGPALIPLWMALAPWLAALVLVILGLRSGFSRLRDAVDHDAERLVESAAAIATAERNPVPPGDYVLDANRHAGSRIIELVEDARQRGASPAPSAPAPAAPPRAKPVLPEEPDLEIDENDEDFLAISEAELDEVDETPTDEAGSGDEDDDLDDLFDLDDEEDQPAPTPSSGGPAPRPTAQLPPPPEEIFRAYDIRGIVGQTLTPDIAYQIGRAIGSDAADHG
ncbi:MAG: hypothetical protein V2I63_04230, partial [Pseudomonadales bacterium]|nr:hypothetical protein [Pseudomonadales bacterium]